MPKPTEPEIDEQFKAAYGELSLKYDEPEEGKKVARSTYWFIKDLKKIAAFLYAEDGFKDALDILESDMVRLYETRSGGRLSNIKKIAVAQSWMGEPIPNNSAFLLQSVLAEKELAENFNGIEEIDEKLHPMKFFGNLISQGFAHNIKSRHLAVDYVGGDHGEYTHRIQWYCISTKAEDLQLDCRSRDDKKTGGLFERSGPVWVKVFDRTEESDVNDFRRPERLNLFLGVPTDDSKRRWPLLTGFLSSRKEKTNGYTLELKKLLVMTHAYKLPVTAGFLRFSKADALKEIVRLKALKVNNLTEGVDKEIDAFLTDNRVLTARDKFYVGSQEKPI